MQTMNRGCSTPPASELCSATCSARIELAFMAPFLIGGRPTGPAQRTRSAHCCAVVPAREQGRDEALFVGHLRCDVVIVHGDSLNGCAADAEDGNLPSKVKTGRDLEL